MARFLAMMLIQAAYYCRNGGACCVPRFADSGRVYDPVNDTTTLSNDMLLSVVAAVVVVKLLSGRLDPGRQRRHGHAGTNDVAPALPAHSRGKGIAAFPGGVQLVPMAVASGGFFGDRS